VSGLQRAVGWFVEPAVPAAPAPLAAVRDGARAAVLGRAGQVEPVAAALALALRDRAHARAAAVAVLGAPDGAGARERPPGAATAAARRLAAQLEQAGGAAVARGRIAWAVLPATPVQAAAAARRVAALGAPAVLAVSAPRSAPLDELLADQDLLVIVTADPDGPLAALAGAGLAAAPVATVAVAPLPAGPRRALALGGIAAGAFGRRLAAETAAMPEAAW
jgi:hypothetical protein